MLIAPTHRVDATPVLILDFDTEDAWDKAKIADESAALKKDSGRHPYAVYQSGDTRYDLAAPILQPDGSHKVVTDYVDLARAWQFNLRRLNGQEFYSLQSLLARDATQAHWLACRMGLVSVSGPGAPAIVHDATGLVSAEGMEALFALKMSLPNLIGDAVINAAVPLKANEKKP